MVTGEEIQITYSQSHFVFDIDDLGDYEMARQVAHHLSSLRDEFRLACGVKSLAYSVSRRAVTCKRCRWTKEFRSLGRCKEIRYRMWMAFLLRPPNLSEAQTDRAANVRGNVNFQSIFPDLFKQTYWLVVCGAKKTYLQQA